MKKAFITILLALSLLLTGCDTETETTTAPESTDTVQNDVGYENIPRNEVKAYTLKLFGFEGDDHALALDIPREWGMTKSDGQSYSMTRDGKDVASLYVGSAPDEDEWTSVKQETSSGLGVTIECNIEKKGSDDGVLYRYRYTYSYKTGEKQRVVTLVSDCAEISKFTHSKLIYAPETRSISSESTVGMLSSKKNCSNILILGNSFIGSSDIGSILRDMLNKNGKSCNVTAISRGYATVKTYIEDSQMLNNISSGYYDIVFICGFYSSGEVANLGVLKSYCDRSNTTLVIFPAHNESSSAVSSAKSKYPTLHCLDWKAELDLLIRNGVSRWDLCVDDAHDHSTPVAGYVGAQMIYRAIYSEAPKAFPSNAISKSDVTSVLGDYVGSGSVKLIDENLINYFD